MGLYDRAESISEIVRSEIKKQTGAASSYIPAQFVAADGTDANLSTITIFGQTATRVRKCAHVGVMTAGQNLICIQGNGIPLTIIGVLVGNIV